MLNLQAATVITLAKPFAPLIVHAPGFQALKPAASIRRDQPQKQLIDWANHAPSRGVNKSKLSDDKRVCTCKTAGRADLTRFYPGCNKMLAGGAAHLQTQICPCRYMLVVEGLQSCNAS